MEVDASVKPVLEHLASKDRLNPFSAETAFMLMISNLIAT